MAISIKLPVWLRGTQVTKLKKACLSFWQYIETFVLLPFAKTDIDNCSVPMLDLIAWERDITRFVGEPEWLYRARVKYAKVNSEDAGSTAGIVRIFERLGIGYVEIEERTPHLEWDVITLRMSDSQLSENPDLLRVLITMYGRTCRRYSFETITTVPLKLTARQFNDDQSTCVARMP